jgi:alcohol dehydrogenase class IV
LGHALGTLTHIDNGLANGILLPHTMRFNAPVTQQRLTKVAEALGEQRSGQSVEAAIRAVENLVTSVNVPPRLRDVGVLHEDLRRVAQAAMEDWFLHLNPRPIVNEEVLMEILEAAW